MLRHSRFFVALLLLAVALSGFACGGSQPPASQAAAQPAAQSAAPQKTVTELTKEMHANLGKITEIERAVIRGDLEGAVEPAKWVVEHQETAGLPAETAPVVADMKKFAGNVAGAKDATGAATSTAMMISYCGKCHEAAKVKAAFPDIKAPTWTKGRAAHMQAHQYAIDLMYQGLAIPSEELWKKGVEALKTAPLADTDLPKDSALTKEIVANETKVHEQAEKALKTTDMGTKVALYGEVLRECASCHGLHGRVWGPGFTPTK
jgi:hypothetical protein